MPLSCFALMSVGAVQLMFTARQLLQVGVGVGAWCHGACCAGGRQSPQLCVCLFCGALHFVCCCVGKAVIPDGPCALATQSLGRRLCCCRLLSIAACLAVTLSKRGVCKLHVSALFCFIMLYKCISYLHKCHVQIHCKEGRKGCFYSHAVCSGASLHQQRYVCSLGGCVGHVCLDAACSDIPSG